MKEAGAEGLTFELLNRNVDQPYKYLRHLGSSTNGARSAFNVTQRVLPTGPWFEAMRSGNFEVDRSTVTARTSSTRSLDVEQIPAALGLQR